MKRKNPSFKCWKEPKPPQITYKIFNIHLLHGLISSLKTWMKRAYLEWFFNTDIEKISARFAHGKQAKKNKY